MAPRQLLSEHAFVKGAMASLPELDPRLAGSFAPGSRNQLVLGLGKSRPWRGLQSKGVNTGGRKMVQVGNTWGSLRDIGPLHGAGSFFQDIGKSLWFIGGGQLNIEGVDLTGLSASTILQVAIAVNGVYDASTTFDAGLPQPDTPDVGIIESPGVGYTGIINGPVSFKIARFRASTGGRSVASITSAVLVPANKSIRITFPLPSEGQKHWHVFSTQEGFGGIGLHYRLRYGIDSAAVLDIPEEVVAAGVIDGIPRSLEFDYHTGDLIPELAYIDDYPPPAGTHAVRIENVMVVLGAVVDSTSAVTTTNTGTVGACSLSNFYESYKPDHRVYFPEQIVDHRARQTDSYAYVAHRNCITALQFVGPRDGPAVALTMILPDVGIEKQQNWCQVGGLLYMRIADGSFVRMKPDGSIDYAWAADIYDLVKDWDSNTVVSPHFDTMSVVISNGSQAYSFSLLNETWSPTCYFADAGVPGTALSAISSRGELIITIANAGVHTAYGWDIGATEMPISSVTPWVQSLSQGLPRSARIREVHVAFETDVKNVPLFIGIHRNLRQPVYVHDARTTSGSDRIDSTSAGFDSDNVSDGDMVLVFGENVGGPGIDYLLGRVALNASPSSSPSPSASASASPSVSVSASPSASPSRSPSSSSSSSLSPSASTSPSHSPSLSPSASPSRSPSASISRSPSSSLSPSASVSRSPSASPSAS